MASNIDLNNGGVYHFTYNAKDDDYTILEEVMVKIAAHLKGHGFLKEQRAEMLVLGYDSDSRVYVLNNPDVWALEKYHKENPWLELLCEKIALKDICHVIIRNMILDGGDSEILIAENVASERGYSYLIPLYLSCNTQELDALITELMKLHMFKIGKSTKLAWLRREYQRK